MWMFVLLEWRIVKISWNVVQNSSNLHLRMATQFFFPSKKVEKVTKITIHVTKK